VRADSLGAGEPEPSRDVGLGMEFLEHVRERLRIAGRHEPARHAVFDRLRHPADLGREHRPPARHRFEQAQRQSFPQRRDHACVGREQQRPDRLELAEKANTRAELEIVDAPFELAPERPLARQRHDELESAALDLHQRLQQHRVTLRLLEPGRAHPQRLERAHAEPVAELARGRPFLRLVRQIGAVRHHTHSRARDSVFTDDRIRDCAAHRGHRVRVRELALRCDLHRLTRARRSMLGHDEVGHARGARQLGQVAVRGRSGAMPVK
jgi:hypothetical protein